MDKSQKIMEMVANISKCHGLDAEKLQYEEDGLDNLNVRIYFTEGHGEEADKKARQVKDEFIKAGYADAEIVKLLDDDDFITVMGTKSLNIPKDTE